jgi:hypothetical protein
MDLDPFKYALISSGTTSLRLTVSVIVYSKKARCRLGLQTVDIRHDKCLTIGSNFMLLTIYVVAYSIILH